MTHTRLCAVCGQPFSRPADVSARRWAERRCCSGHCGRRLAGTLSSVWSDADLARASALRTRGLSWAEAWREVTGGIRSSPAALRIAVAARARRPANPLRGRIEGGLTAEPEMDEGRAAAVLARPPARIAALLRQLPACELRLVSWPLDSVGAPPWTR
jgi:hypothetical protein